MEPDFEDYNLIRDFLTLKDLLLTPDTEDTHNNCEFSPGEKPELYFVLSIKEPFEYNIMSMNTTDVVCPIGIIQHEPGWDVTSCFVIAYFYLTSDNIGNVILSKEVSVPAKNTPRESIFKSIPLNISSDASSEFRLEEIDRILSYVFLVFQNEITKEMNKLSKNKCYCTFRSDIIETKEFDRIKNLITDLLMEKIYSIPTI